MTIAIGIVPNDYANEVCLHLRLVTQQLDLRVADVVVAALVQVLVGDRRLAEAPPRANVGAVIIS